MRKRPKFQQYKDALIVAGSPRTETEIKILANLRNTSRTRELISLGFLQVYPIDLTDRNRYNHKHYVRSPDGEVFLKHYMGLEKRLVPRGMDIEVLRACQSQSTYSEILKKTGISKDILNPHIKNLVFRSLLVETYPYIYIDTLHGREFLEEYEKLEHMLDKPNVIEYIAPKSG